MTSKLKKKISQSSLNTKYVDNFLNSIESKLYNFNTQFLTPYKKKLNSGDKSVISEIAKDFKLPTLVIKNALDELWNYHWMLGQKDVLNTTPKRTISNYEQSNSIITFAKSDTEVIKKRKEISAEKEILQDLNKRIIRLEKDINKKSDRYTKDSLKATLKGITRDLDKYLGSSSGTQSEQTAVRIRDLQETIRTLDLKLSEAKSPTPENKDTGIDILNSTEFGTIYQDKRTLLLAGSVSKDYKQKVINKIQNYFDNTNGVRDKNREQKLFDSLTTKTKDLKVLKELAGEDKLPIDTFGIKRIKRIAETEISVAYNIGRLKKLEELGYTRVKITNEKENRINREVALSKYGSLKKVYSAEDSEKYMPILCTHCLGRSNDAPLDINEVYRGKVDTKYNGKYSLFPPFHVSCWCYLVGTEGDGKEKSFIPQVDNALLLSGVGLLSVAGAYLAYNQLGKKKIDIPKTIQNVTTNIGNTINNLLGRPKVKIPLKLTPKQIEDTKEVLDVSDDVFRAVQLETNNLLGTPINLSPKTSPELVEEVILDQIDEVITNKPYKVLNLAPKTFNQVVDDIPDYVQSLRPIENAREEYYRLRNIIYDTSVPLETRQSLYNTYITSRTKYDSLITKHLEDTRNLKNTVNNINSQMSVDTNREILANRNNLPTNLTLEEALNNVRSRKALSLTDTQLKTIRDNLTLERKGLREKISIESKVLDSTLEGIDTQQKAVDLRTTSSDINEITSSYTKTKALDKVISNIDSIKKELNNISTNKETIRSLSTSRINSGSLVDRTLLIDTQETYIKKVLEQQKVLAKELQKLPSGIDKVDNFVNLYRSEIMGKANKNYPYSNNVWNSSELNNLDKQYRKASELITTRNTYQSYLDETEDMLAKLSNFETTIIDDSIKFSLYSDDIIRDRDLLKKISKLPNINNIVFNK
jgi:hypothetical protein